jgi:hypothetical protein
MGPACESSFEKTDDIFAALAHRSRLATRSTTMSPDKRADLTLTVQQITSAVSVAEGPVETLLERADTRSE